MLQNDVNADAQPIGAEDFCCPSWCLCLQLKWGVKLGLDLKESNSGFEDKKEFHKLVRSKLGISS